MRSSARKLLGTILFLAFVLAYVWLAMIIGAGRIVEANPWLQFAYFAVAGFLWVLPAGLIIRWMQKPDPAPSPMVKPR